MKRKILSFLAILVVFASATALISDAHTDMTLGQNTEEFKGNMDENEKGDSAAVTSSALPKSKLTLAILFLGGVGLAVFRRNSFL